MLVKGLDRDKEASALKAIEDSTWSGDGVCSAMVLVDGGDVLIQARGCNKLTFTVIANDPARWGAEAVSCTIAGRWVDGGVMLD